MDTPRRAARRRPSAVAAFLFACVLAGVPTEPASADTAHSVSVNVYRSNGFIHADAWFEDSPGASSVTVWIEAYSPTTGTAVAVYGRRDAHAPCDHGHCYVSLRTAVQASHSECYVARAITWRPTDAYLVQAADPPAGLFCP